MAREERTLEWIENRDLVYEALVEVWVDLFEEDYNLHKLEALAGSLVESNNHSIESLIDNISYLTSQMRDANNPFGTTLRVLLFQAARQERD